MIREITILPGLDKSGVKEHYANITLSAGETISIVGPTGSGKTAFITDIELLAQEDTSTRRSGLVNMALQKSCGLYVRIEDIRLLAGKD